MDPATRAFINSVGLIMLTAMFTFAAAWFWHTRKAKDDKTTAIAEATKRLTDRVNELEAEHRLVKAAVQPITSAFQAILIKELTHFHTPELDALMAKLLHEPPITLTEHEERRMAVLLEERTRDMGEQISDSEREAATILPVVIKRARVEAAEIAKDSKLAVVAIANHKEES